MVDYATFKQIRKKYQGRYFKRNLGAGYTTYRHIRKVDFCDDSSDRLIFHYYYHFQYNCIERRYSIRRKIEEIEDYFGERITPSEYRMNIKEYTHEEYV